MWISPPFHRQGSDSSGLGTKSPPPPGPFPSPFPRGCSFRRGCPCPGGGGGEERGTRRRGTAPTAEPRSRFISLDKIFKPMP